MNEINDKDQPHGYWEYNWEYITGCEIQDRGYYINGVKFGLWTIHSLIDGVETYTNEYYV
jgi:hypothetical protein